ncbi:hypothetical protein LTR28_011829, partial [Elasticomyces elasticus]
MAPFFGKFKGNAGPASPANGASPAKKDPNAPQLTSLEKHLVDATGPVRSDGSDKFFGFENVPPFRESVMNFPSRTPLELLTVPPSAPRNPDGDTTTSENGALSPVKSKAPLFPGGANGTPRKATPTVGSPGPPGTRPEDNPASPEYRKKLALAAGPVLNMEYDNSRNYGMSENLFTSLKDIFEAIIANQSRIGV